MPDVVEQGPADERERGLPPGVRQVALVLVLLAVAFLLTRSGLLSADAPERADRPAPLTVPEIEDASRLVAQVDEHLVRPGQGDWSDGPRLPGDAPSSLVPVLSGDGTGSVVGVVDGQLFSVATSRNATWAPIGRARAVVAASPVPGRVVIWRGRRVVEVDSSTGRLLDEAPYPGFDRSEGWSPEALVAVTGTHALLMSRPVAGGTRQELALAWPAARVEAAIDPSRRTLGAHGRLLGTADDWVLTQSGCPGAGCRVRIISVARDEVHSRDVVAPEGWAFTGGPSAGRTHEALVPVQRLDGDGVVALARLVPGGDNALLVLGTEGVDLDAGLVETLAGAVYLVTRPSAGGPERLRVWRPERPGRAELVTGEGTLPETARLVCVCG